MFDSSRLYKPVGLCKIAQVGRPAITFCIFAGFRSIPVAHQEFCPPWRTGRMVGFFAAGFPLIVTPTPPSASFAFGPPRRASGGPLAVGDFTTTIRFRVSASWLRSRNGHKALRYKTRSSPVRPPSPASACRAYINHFRCSCTTSPNFRMNCISSADSGPSSRAARFSRSCLMLEGAVKQTSTLGLESTKR